MRMPEKLIIGEHYFMVFFEKGNVLIIKTLRYLGINVDNDFDVVNDEYFFEDVDYVFINPKHPKKKPITIEKEINIPAASSGVFAEKIPIIRLKRRGIVPARD